MHISLWTWLLWGFASCLTLLISSSVFSVAILWGLFDVDVKTRYIHFRDSNDDCLFSLCISSCYRAPIIRWTLGSSENTELSYISMGVCSGDGARYHYRYMVLSSSLASCIVIQDHPWDSAYVAKGRNGVVELHRWPWSWVWKFGVHSRFTGKAMLTVAKKDVQRVWSLVFFLSLFIRNDYIWRNTGHNKRITNFHILA